MEARSLASINYLAANPPQYPINPSEEKPEPLTLYISRVPGTRDVILSPYKPGLKNVTAQDVASSLYYVHLELPSSSASKTNPLSSQEGYTDPFAGEDYERHDAIPRKPLPQEAKQVTPDRSNEHLPAAGMPARKPVPRPVSPLTTSFEDQPHPTTQTHPEATAGPVHDQLEALPPPEPKSLLTPAFDSVPARRPLGPRAMQLDRPVLMAEEKEMLAESEFPVLSHPSQDLPPLPQEGFEVHGSVYVADHDARPRSSDSPANRASAPAAPAPSRSRAATTVTAPAAPPSHPTPPSQSSPSFSLTLIRRDPASGHQWNVGHISSQYSDAGPGTHHPPSYPAIDVQIENTGYSKFRNMPLPPAPSADGAEAMLQALVGRSQEPLSEEIQQMMQEAKASASPQGTTFTRQVSMAYAKSWTSNIMEKFQKIEKQGWRSSVTNVLQNRARAGSESAVPPTLQAAAAASPAQEDSAPGAKMRPRGYHFTSPWSTECEFRTGNNGRSVKCMHTIQDSGSYNPLVDGHGEEEDEGEQRGSNNRNSSSGGGARTVSELRFNLPAGDIFPSSSKENDLAAAGQRMKGHFSKFLRQGSVDYSASDSDHHDDDEESDGAVSPFDINLGAEKAGGGNRGKRAKLGKLIIHGDGLKMLDLVVAANMGVWWGAWERTM